MNFLHSILATQLGNSCSDAIAQKGFLESGCSLLASSKLVGLLVIFLSVIMKIPQIRLIMKTRSSEGLNLSSIMIETVAFNIIACFCFLNKQSFTTYGDTVFIVLQNFTLLYLIFKYNEKVTNIVRLTLGFIGLNYYLLQEASDSLLNALMLLLLPMMLFGTIPQLLQNYQNQSSGNLSPASVFIGYFSCLSRVFTNWVEVDSVIAQVGSGLGAVINTILVYQVLAYSSNTLKKKALKKKIN